MLGTTDISDVQPVSGPICVPHSIGVLFKKN